MTPLTAVHAHVAACPTCGGLARPVGADPLGDGVWQAWMRCEGCGGGWMTEVTE